MIEVVPVRIPTIPVPVTVTMGDGRLVEMTFYLAAASPFHDGPETMDEYLSSPRRFVPARTADGRSHLVGLEAVASVVVPRDAPLLSRLPGWVVTSLDFVRLRLSSGAAVEGMIVASRPPESARLSDIFNEDEPFAVIEGSSGVIFVRKSAISEVEI